MGDHHLPVLLAEVLEGVAVKPEGRYIDATFGRGGHSQALLQQLGPEGELLVIDKDPQAIAVAKALATETTATVHVRHGSFAQLGDFVAELGWAGQVDGIMMDLGVSSPQLDEAARGFSFMRQGPLDMRMNTSFGMTAADWVNTATKDQIADVLWRYGEERQSRKIASAIVMDRDKQPFVTTLDLADMIARIIPRRGKNHPATKSFQAIRIHINNELADLEKVLSASVSALKIGGRLAVISFHSLEDRMVKQFMRRMALGEQDNLPKDLPIRSQQAQDGVLKLLGGAIKPSKQEVEGNSRARSARLRIAEKLNESNA